MENKLSREGVAVIVSTAVLTSAATLAVGLRIWARKLKSMRFGVDDYLAIGTLAVQYSIMVETVCGMLSRVFQSAESGLRGSRILSQELTSAGVMLGGLGRDLDVVVAGQRGMEPLLKVIDMQRGSKSSVPTY